MGADDGGTEMRDVPDIALANVGDGPSPYRVADRAAAPELDWLVVLFQRDRYCRNCRRQVRAIADRYDEFVRRHAEVVSVLPESPAVAATWQDAYHLPFPLLADPGGRVGERLGQPIRFGRFGERFDLLGRMPLALVFDVRNGATGIAYSHEGRRPADRPDVDELLREIDVLGAR